MIGWAFNGATSDLSQKHEITNSVYEWNLVTLKTDGSPVWNPAFPIAYEAFMEGIVSGAVSHSAVASSATALLLALTHF